MKRVIKGVNVKDGHRAYRYKKPGGLWNPYIELAFLNAKECNTALKDWQFEIESNEPEVNEWGEVCP